MKEQLISFETAKLAKEKGYNITNYLSYDENTGVLLPKSPAYPGWHDYALDGACPAPTQSILQKWLREEHKIEVNPCHSCSGKYDLWTNWGNLLPDPNGLFRDFETYEEVLEQGLLEALKLIK